MKLSKDFESGEFTCGCGCQKDKVSPTLIAKLQLLRDIINKPIIITSGYRCVAYNKHINGSVYSPHLTGEGADCYCNGMAPVTLAIIADKINHIRLGIYSSHLHIDVRPAMPSKYWIFKDGKYTYSGKEKDLSKFIKKNL